MISSSSSAAVRGSLRHSQIVEDEWGTVTRTRKGIQNRNREVRGAILELDTGRDLKRISLEC
jgi:hypothetical protein